MTAFLSNDATAVVLTPAVLTIVQRLKIEPRPHLLACAFIANAASFLLPISNPANLVIYASRLPALPAWLAAYLAPSLAAIGLTFGALRFVSRRDLEGGIEVKPALSPLSTGGRLALGGLGLAAIVLIAASCAGLPLGAPTCGAALAAGGLVAWRDRAVAGRVARGVSWSVLPLVAGLFVLVDALQSAGGLRLAVAGLDALRPIAPAAGNLLLAGAVALLSNGMNNLPVGLIGGAALHAAGGPTHLDHALLIGVDLGPNLSVTGSLATILWLIALRREKVEITGWQFFRAGLVAMPPALIGSVLLLGRRG